MAKGGSACFRPCTPERALRRDMMATLRTTVWLMRLLAGVSLGLAAIAGAREDQRPLVNQADGWAKDKKSPFSKEFAELARAKLEEWKVPGLAMAVVDGEDIFAEVRCRFLSSSSLLLRRCLSRSWGCD